MFRWESLLMPHLDEVDKLVVDVGSLGQEETAPRSELMEEVQLLLLAKLGMVFLGSFFLQADREHWQEQNSQIVCYTQLGNSFTWTTSPLTPCTHEHPPTHLRTYNCPPINTPAFTYLYAIQVCPPHPPTHLAATPASPTTPRFRAAPPT